MGRVRARRCGRRASAVAIAVVLVVLVAERAAGGGPPPIGVEALQRANPDGTARQVLVPADVAEGRGVLAVGTQSVFWIGGVFETPFGPFAWVRRAGLEGRGRQDILGPSLWGGIAVDPVRGKLYLTPQSDCAPGCTSIVRTDLDGSNGEVLYPAGSPGAIAVHPASQLVCWSDFGFGDVGDPLEPAIVCGRPGEPEGQVVVGEAAQGLAIDPLNEQLYWIPAFGNRIRRAALDGKGVEDVLVGLDSPQGLAIDPAGNRLWWTESSSGRIRQAALDGSGVQDVLTGLEGPTAVAFAQTPGGDKLYWLSISSSTPVPGTSVRGALLLGLVLLGLGTAWRVRGSAS